MSARSGKKKVTKLSRSSRAGVIFPVGRMMRYLRTGTHKYRIGMGAPVYMAAVIEYLAGRRAAHRDSSMDVSFGSRELSNGCVFTCKNTKMNQVRNYGS
nr:core histone macro-H2A.2-like [Nothobranchius furzeri]